MMRIAPIVMILTGYRIGPMGVGHSECKGL